MVTSATESDASSRTPHVDIVAVTATGFSPNSAIR